jgi:hypothetical protein
LGKGPRPGGGKGDFLQPIATDPSRRFGFLLIIFPHKGTIRENML